ncbi:LINE-1 type transposase domain containing protein 1 [Dissostichus eleginoides]|uniref:LINE-1 type transposase domain containing protein 1 n=1 Tax=Dissostichus eleginoides TaxID=100907 RepID=A0AAD9BV87_DISEL|nr:LINE-1 type transposase domain containing protein 1 [Dissostichus eleginoides]
MKTNASWASTKSNKVTRAANELDAIADLLIEKQREFFEPRFAQLQEMGKCTDNKLNVMQSELATLSGIISMLKTEISTLKCSVEDNSKEVAVHTTALRALDLKIADMEDRSSWCNIRVIGLKEGTEGSNAMQYLTQSLPKWLPSLPTEQLEIMRAHRLNSGRANG